MDKDTNIYLDYINQIDNKTKNSKKIFQPLEEYINELNDAINNIPKIAKKESSIKYPVNQFVYRVQDIIDNIKRVDKASEVLYRKMNICIKAYDDCHVSRNYAIKIYNIFISYMNITISLLDRQLDQLLKAYEKIINHGGIEISETYHDLYTNIKFL